MTYKFLNPKIIWENKPSLPFHAEKPHPDLTTRINTYTADTNIVIKIYSF